MVRVEGRTGDGALLVAIWPVPEEELTDQMARLLALLPDLDWAVVPVE